LPRVFDNIDLPLLPELQQMLGLSLYPDPDEWFNSGDSVIVSPGGEILADPLRMEQGDPQRRDRPRDRTRRALHVGCRAHYNRPDVFSLRVDRSARPQVAFDDGAARPASVVPKILEL
jgi:hypothetical protein